MEKKTKLDLFIYKVIDEYLDRVILCILILAALAIRFVLMGVTELSPDYDSYYLPWVNAYREYGFFTGLGKEIGDYYVPYNVMYAICSLFSCEPYIPLTIFSTVAEFVSAFYLYKILMLLLSERGAVDQKDRRMAVLLSAGSLFLPFVVFNGSLWKQCDAIYVVFVVIAVYHLLRCNYRLSFVFLAIAFSFKLQTVLFVPLFILAYVIRKEYSILKFLWIPFMYLVMGLPSVLCKKGIRATYLAYMSQTGEISTEDYGMVSYYPNFYNFGLDDFDEYLKLPGIMLTAAVLVLLVAFAYGRREYFIKNENLLLLGLFMAFSCCMFLPGMHERYDYGIVLIMTVFCFGLKRKLLPVAIIMNMTCLLTYIIVLFAQYDMSMKLISAVQVFAYFYLGYMLITDRS